MKSCCHFASLGLVAAMAVAGSIAFAQSQTPPKERDKPAPSKAAQQTPPDQMPQLPPGWTEADMQACMAAGTPGEQHAHLAESVGTWHGKTTMWMAPGTEPMTSECTSSVTPMMDGRFTKC
jgi:hypothetical protein